MRTSKFKSEEPLKGLPHQKIVSECFPFTLVNLKRDPLRGYTAFILRSHVSDNHLQDVISGLQILTKLQTPPCLTALRPAVQQGCALSGIHLLILMEQSNLSLQLCATGCAVHLKVICLIAVLDDHARSKATDCGPD